jgi:hypothetical protein
LKHKDQPPQKHHWQKQDLKTPFDIFTTQLAPLAWTDSPGKPIKYSKK